VTVANVAFLLGGLLVGMLALVGILDAVRGTPVREVLPFGPEKLPGVRDPGFRTAMELLARTPLSKDNHVEVFWNGDQTYPRLWEDLRSARESIAFQMYWCKPGRMADTLSEILCERARAGVKVRFLYDAWGTSIRKDWIERMQAAGVQTEKFRPIHILHVNKFNHRAHIRVVIVDDRVGYTGGFGIDDKWFGNGRAKDQWRDSNVRFVGPAVNQLRAAFSACWAETTGELLVGDVCGAADAANGDGNAALAGVLHGAPAVGSTDAERFFALSIASAREKLYITNSYFVPDRDFRRMLVDAAKRGADVRILTVCDRTDVKSTWYAGRARYEYLLDGGVRIFEYQPTMIHAKTMTVDGLWSAVGSMNADNRSLSFNEETVLLMLCERMAATVEAHFMDDLAHAKEIRLDEFRRRGAFERMKESVCYAFWRVL
jgi:cardiolipin synthase